MCVIIIIEKLDYQYEAKWELSMGGSKVKGER